jgi:DNA polymerase III beta subunit, C-terminal domain
MPDTLTLPRSPSPRRTGATCVRLGPRRLDGNPITVAFHPRRLLDALIATGTGRARLALTTPAKPALFTLAGDSQDDDSGPG